MFVAFADTSQSHAAAYTQTTIKNVIKECSYLNMTEGVRARVHSQFYERKISYEIIFYLAEILGYFLDKDNHVICL